MSGSWSNTTQSLIVLVEQVSGYSGLFAYSPTPAAGNLVLSIAAAAGTDPYGNAFAAGLTLYSPSGTINFNGTAATWALPDGSGIEIVVGPGSVLEEFEPATVTGVTWDRGGIGATLQSRLGANTPLTFVSSPKNSAFAGTASSLSLYGAPQTSNGDVQSEAILSAARTTVSSATGWISGAWTKQAEVWNTPSFNANWSGTTVFGTISGGLQSLQYRKDAEDNLWVIGCFKAATGAGSSVFQLPAGYRPLTNNAFPVVAISSSGATSQAWMYISTAGNLNINSQLGSGVTAGSTYYINAKIPLGNIP